MQLVLVRVRELWWEQLTARVPFRFNSISEAQKRRPKNQIKLPDRETFFAANLAPILSIGKFTEDAYEFLLIARRDFP